MSGLDLASAECIVKAATRCHQVMLERIAADPDNPIVPDLQAVADSRRNHPKQRRKNTMSATTARRSHPWTFRRRLACFFGEQLVPGRHYQFRVRA